MVIISNATVPASLATSDLPAGPVDIHLDGSTIAAITPHDAAATAGGTDEIVDAGGAFVTPGLIDTHVHLLGREHLDQFVAAGVTTVVDLGSWPDTFIEQLHTETGTADFISAGPPACAPGGTQVARMGAPAEAAVTGPDDAERYVAWRADSGARVIKIIIEDPHGPVPGLTPDTLAALVRAAHQRNLLTIAHAVTPSSYAMGLDAGVDILTHTPLTAAVGADQAQRMRTQGTICSPTLVMMRQVATAMAGHPGPPMNLDNAIESVRAMVEAGVPVIAGTDANASPGSPAPVPHGTSLHDELALLVQAGMTPTQAITAATSAAAEALRLDDRGVLAPGKRADLVLFAADPTDDITNSRSVQQVWSAGVRLR